MDYLPPIIQMYNSTRQNHDYSAIRTYQDCRKDILSKKKATKRGHYLQDHIKSYISPGPANKSNIQPIWASRSANQLKHSDRKTYIDEIQHISKKQNLPPPCRYQVQMPWPKPTDKVIHASEKLTFVDNCLYESDKTPGPGKYQISTRIGCKKEEGKIANNKPLQPKNNISADMNTYTPISQQYQTFTGIHLKNKDKSPSSPNLKLSKSTVESISGNKKSLIPGPGYYQVINTWLGREKLRKGERNYWNKLSTGPSSSIYYGHNA